MVAYIKFYARNRKYFNKRWRNNISHKIYLMKSFLEDGCLRFKYFIQGRDLMAELHEELDELTKGLDV